ncbi:MAG: 1-deoxy-D-xylulose-5-phosphate reductoisomerase [Proteobacteria bacterium]|nr:1-deoxy-D-xylulose-5-phosphate reductoisomerase [Pseudomonadota bacterium]MDA1058574.1 1-deoxy-D-xylulose-5-phosphate reductoisomerase [Pseudomonadota bacterium]
MALAEPRPVTAPRRVSILGSTGSVGCSTLDLIARNPGVFQVEALTAHRNVAGLAAQARKFRPAIVAIADPSCYETLRDALSDTGIEVAAGPKAVVEAASRPADWVMAAIVGAAGLAPTLAAARQGAILAIANKECLVSAGDLFMAEAARHGTTVLPVDSEHNAIFQVFDFEGRDAIERIILTASGGPFRDTPLDRLAHVTPTEALAHPNWDMGAKVSIDSATMMNKGLELIEAHYLFDMAEPDIEVLIHPQSIVHSMVGYADGSVLAQLGTPDMRTPIAYTLAWPERMDAPAERLDLAKIGTLSFQNPDFDRFPALRLAREALQTGNGATTILNAANEVAVKAFLEGRAKYLDIVAIVETTLEIVDQARTASLADVLALDAEARRVAEQYPGVRGA